MLTVNALEREAVAPKLPESAFSWQLLLLLLAPAIPPISPHRIKSSLWAFYSTSKIQNPQVWLNADAAFRWLRLGILCEGVDGRGDEVREPVRREDGEGGEGLNYLLLTPRL